MKYWYYEQNNQQNGPFNFEELKSKRLKKSTLVWAEGMDDWASANTIDELKDIFVSEPPPLPKKRVAEPPPLPLKSNIESTGSVGKKPSATSTKPDIYDYSYSKEPVATAVGVVLFFLHFILLVSGTFEDTDLNTLTAFGIVLRLLILTWVVNIANRQNRNSVGWGIFAFFIPTLALIIIGLMNKLKRSEDERPLVSERINPDDNI